MNYPSVLTLIVLQPSPEATVYVIVPDKKLYRLLFDTGEDWGTSSDKDSFEYVL